MRCKDRGGHAPSKYGGVDDSDSESREVEISAFMVYVRAGGEGAKFVSQALTEPEE